MTEVSFRPQTDVDSSPPRNAGLIISCAWTIIHVCRMRVEELVRAIRIESGARRSHMRKARPDDKRRYGSTLSKARVKSVDLLR